MTSPRTALFFCLVFASACSGDPAASSVAEPDASHAHDAGADSGAPESDMAMVPDASDARDLGVDVRPTESRCAATDAQITCPYETVTLATGFTGLVDRDVHYQLPSSGAPATGYPVVLFFQGSLFSGELAFSATAGDPFGAMYQTALVQELLDRGYAVLAPEAHLDGSTYWDTNVPPYSVDWDLAPDHRFMQDIFAAIEAGEFGALDADRMFATGISSGGYMTSRMAVSYPGRFRALAVNAGSYATCSGALCLIPELPSDHPPTLFVMGEDDLVVPLQTGVDYHEKLQPIADTELVVSPGLGHAWAPEAPLQVADWFDVHR